MSNLWKELRSLTASRTGMPVAYDYEDSDRVESQRGMWIILIAVAIAFITILQMDAESVHAKAKKELAGRISANLWESS